MADVFIREVFPLDDVQSLYSLGDDPIKKLFLIITSNGRGKYQRGHVRLFKVFKEKRILNFINTILKPGSAKMAESLAQGKIANGNSLKDILISGIKNVLRNHPDTETRISLIKEGTAQKPLSNFPGYVSSAVIGVVVSIIFYCLNTSRTVEVLGLGMLYSDGIDLQAVSWMVYHKEIKLILASINKNMFLFVKLFLAITVATMFTYNFIHPDLKKPIPLHEWLQFVYKLGVAYIIAYITFEILMDNIHNIWQGTLPYARPKEVKISELFILTGIFVYILCRGKPPKEKAYAGKEKKLVINETNLPGRLENPCHFHHGTESSNICNLCERSFCPSCLTKIDDMFYCYECINNTLYGKLERSNKAIKKKMADNLFSRRAFSFIVDAVLFFLLLKAFGYILTYGLVAFPIILFGKAYIPQQGIFRGMMIGFYLLFMIREFTFRKGGHRQSLGKRILGVETVNINTGKRASFWAHILRNSPIVLIFIVNWLILLYMAGELWYLKTYSTRWIDRIAKARVQRTNTGIF